MLTMRFFDEVKEMRRLQIVYANGSNMSVRTNMLRSQDNVDRMIRQIDAQRESQKPKQQPLPGWFHEEQSDQDKT